MTTKKKIVFVVNPISGTQGKRAILKWIDERINRTLYDYTIVKTQYAGHAEKIAATAAKEKVDIVVAIGGDGTINEIGRALIHTDTALGIIPCGSGNGLARHLQIPLEPKAAIDIINESSVACIDYGKINNIPFFCTCGVGFDAFVSLKFADSGKRGLLTYLENTLHESLSYKPETYEIENEEGTSSTVNGSNIVTSINPSVNEACGAIYALFPYWEALPQAIRKALYFTVPSSFSISTKP